MILCLQEDAVGGGCTVLILVSPEVDAIAACRLLTYLLRVDNIQYKIKLVSLLACSLVCHFLIDSRPTECVLNLISSPPS